MNDMLAGIRGGYFARPHVANLVSIVSDWDLGKAAVEIAPPHASYHYAVDPWHYGPINQHAGKYECAIWFVLLVHNRFGHIH
jgi:hypothetical protein